MKTPVEIIKITLEQFCNVEQDQEAQLVLEALENEGYSIISSEEIANEG